VSHLSLFCFIRIIKINNSQSNAYEKKSIQVTTMYLKIVKRQESHQSSAIHVNMSIIIIIIDQRHDTLMTFYRPTWSTTGTTTRVGGATARRGGTG